jgi:hypothetical protein
MKKQILLLVLLLISLITIPAFAAPLRVFVSEINTAGGQSKDEMKPLLQTLLASRLNSDAIVAVGSISEADVVVTGTYVTIGKMFSLDAIAKTSAGKTLTRAFVQGESQDELIPAVGKLADKLSAELTKGTPAVVPVVAAAAPAVAVAVPVVKPVATGDIIKPALQEQDATVGLSGKRLPGAHNLMAGGLTMADGSREIFLADERRLAYYRYGSDIKLIAEAEVVSPGKIISLDTLAGNNGELDIYVTVMRSDELVSQVWQVKGDKLVIVADKQPFFFRTVSLAGGPKKLYVQTTGSNSDFYGDVAEATRNGSTITVKSSIKLPRFGMIYNFNQFRDRSGKVLTVVLDPDLYLVIYDEKLQELWRSNDKFGGSELYFLKEETSNLQITGDKNRWVFMNQRLMVTAKGEILAVKNDSSWVMGNSRTYKSGSVYCLAWDGSSLEEKWHTREAQNYMPDYLLDESRNELLLLQTVQRPGFLVKGASSLSIKKME